MNRKVALASLRDQHLAQKEEKNLRTQYLEKVVYTNPVRDEYFEQFGKSCR